MEQAPSTPTHTHTRPCLAPPGMPARQREGGSLSPVRVGGGVSCPGICIIVSVSMPNPAREAACTQGLLDLIFTSRSPHPFPQKDSRPTFLLFMIATSDHHLALRPSAPLLPTKPSLTVTIYLSTTLFFIAEVSLLVFITPTLGWFLSMFRFGNSSLLPST